MKNWPGTSIPCIMNIGGVDIPTLRCFEAVFQNILTIAVSLAVLALFVMLIIGGFRFLTSGGDAKQAGAARATMTYAVIGIALLALTFLIFKLIESFTGVKNLLKFEIPNQP